MAIGIEFTGGNSATNAASVSKTGVTVTSANLALVGVSIGETGSVGAFLTGVTLNGQAMTQVPSSVAFEAVGQWTSVVWYYIVNPQAGTATATFTGSLHQSAIHVITFTGASTTLNAASTATGTSANPSLTVAASASGDIVVAVISNDNESGNTVQANTLIFEAENVGSDTDHSSQYTTASGANTAMGWTQSGSGNGWAASGLAVSPSSGGGGPTGPPPGTLLMMGAGT